MAEPLQLFEQADWPVLFLAPDGKLMQGNAAAVTAFGPVISTGTSALADIWATDNSLKPHAFLNGPHAAQVPLRFRGLNGVPVTAVAVVIPVTGGHLLQLLPPPPMPPAAGVSNTADVQKQKLDCALQLARTMALDFNNALTSILGHTSLLLGRMEPTHPWRSSLVEVEKSAARAAEIASDLATFSRQEKEPVRGQTSGNLNQLLQRVMELFQNAEPERANWNLVLARKLYSAKFDEAKLQQVFVKIVENSLQAVGKEARITIQTRNIDLTAPTQDRNAQLGAGTYVCTEIADNGRGIDADSLPRVFEPFYTTKSAPHRGLGLAWVYGVVTNHGGAVAISSTPGQGTSVRVYLPAEKKMIQDAAVDNESLKGTATVLIVDDEDLLLTMGQAVLSSFGYQVVTANTGQKALEILTKNDPAIALLITDLVMPSMSGRELVDQARQLHPELRVLSTSGYVFSGKEEADPSYLQKPFTSRELLLKVKQALAPEE
ncbi:MAG: hypothetical protein RL380_321 [Verrucomicrobiota bacterium]|jgi:signal transduction histidine kinase